MQPVFLLEKTSKHFSRMIELIRNQSEIKIKDVKKICSRSSYYAIIITRLYSINKILREINPKLYLAEPGFSITNTKNVFTTLKRCDLIEIESKQDYYLLRYKDGKNQDNSSPRNA